MNPIEEQAKQEKSQGRQTTAITKKQSVIDSKTGRDLLRASAKDFKELLEFMNRSGLPMEKIHKFNSYLAGIGDQCDLKPGEIVLALTLLIKYIIFHSNLNNGARESTNIPLLLELRSVIDKLASGPEKLDV